MPEYKMTFSAAGQTQIGQKRENNEDNFLIGSHYKKECTNPNDFFTFTSTNRCRYILFGVFDGMGGGPYGEYASLYAAEEMCDIHMKLTDSLSPEQVSCLVSSAFQTVNNRIIRDSSNILGTTAVVCILDRKEMAVKYLWSGDSRGYLYRYKTLLQITDDQSVAAASMKKGIYSRTDPNYKNDLHRLTGFIGRDAYGYNFHPEETAWMKLKQNDMIFLMTDGVFSSCSNTVLETEIHKNTDCFSVSGLIDAAMHLGSVDDISVVQIKFDFLEYKGEEDNGGSI